MPFNGSGIFTLVTGNPVITGTTISSTTQNNTTSDFATGLSTCLTKDGQTTPTANIPLGGNKLTGLGAATTNGDAVRFEQVPAMAQAQNGQYYTTGGTSTAYTLTPTPAITSLVAGQRFNVVFNATNGAAATLAISGLAATALKVYNSAGAKVDPSAGALVANMISDVIYDGTDYVVLDQLPLNQASIQGAFKNLRSSANGTSANIAITADEIVVEDTSNNYLTLRNVSLTLVCSGSGANGLDTGTLAGSTVYHKWVIYNPTTATTAALLSLSSTAPTMPSGYTYKARVGAISTDGTANKYPLGHTSFGADTDLIVKAATNVVNRPQLISGVQGSPTVPTYVAASISAYVPSTACRVRGNGGLGGGAGGAMMAAPNNAYGGAASTGNPPPLAVNLTSSGASLPFDFALESTNLYYACDRATGTLCLGGWRDTI